MLKVDRLEDKSAENLWSLSCLQTGRRVLLLGHASEEASTGDDRGRSCPARGEKEVLTGLGRSHHQSHSSAALRARVVTGLLQHGQSRGHSVSATRRRAVFVLRRPGLAE